MASAYERQNIDVQRREIHARWWATQAGACTFIPTHAHDDGGPRLIPLMRIGSDEDGDIFVTGRGELAPYRVALLSLARLDRAGLIEMLVDVRRKRREIERQRGTQEIVFGHRGRNYRTNASGTYLEVQTEGAGEPSAATAPLWVPVQEWSMELMAAAREAGSGAL